MAEWQLKSLAEVVELRRGFDLPTRKREPGPYPVLSAGVTAGWHSEGPVTGPGFVVGRATNLGVPTWCQTDFWPLNTTLYAADFKGNVPRFLFHLFESLDLSGYDSGSVQPMLNRNYIADIKVRVPSVHTQRAIAEVLGALDDKIAANDRAARIAQDLSFATLRGAAEGGERVQLRDSVNLLTRGVTPKYTEEQSGLLVLNQKCVRNRTINLDPARRMVPLTTRLDRILRRNDVLVNSTGYGTLGRTARWSRDETATVDTHITLVRFDETRVDPICAGTALVLRDREIEMLAEGSTGQTELKRDLLGGIELALPARTRQKQIGQRIDELSDVCVQLDSESRVLAATRDELLPLLMSGKIRVKDAERRVEGAV